MRTPSAKMLALAAMLGIVGPRPAGARDLHRIELDPAQLDAVTAGAAGAPDPTVPRTTSALPNVYVVSLTEARARALGTVGASATVDLRQAVRAGDVVAITEVHAAAGAFSLRPGAGFAGPANVTPVLPVVTWVSIVAAIEVRAGSGAVATAGRH